MSVKRYIANVLREEPWGDLVNFGDYAALERKLAAKDARIGELKAALGEVHRLAHDRPTKDILPIIHAITEPWHIHHDAALESKSTSLIYKIYGNRDRAALADVKKKPCPTTE